MVVRAEDNVRKVHITYNQAQANSIEYRKEALEMKMLMF